jgi:predicted MFS family arabinose efflux permease
LACGAALGGVLIAHLGVGAVGVLCALGTVLGIGCYLAGSLTNTAEPSAALANPAP